MADPIIGIELKREADIVTQKKISGFLEEYLIARMKAQAALGHYTYEIGFVPERHSMNSIILFKFLIYCLLVSLPPLLSFYFSILCALLSFLFLYRIRI